MADGVVEFRENGGMLTARVWMLTAPLGDQVRTVGTVDKEALYKAGLEDEWQQLMRKLAATVKESA